MMMITQSLKKNLKYDHKTHKQRKVTKNNNDKKKNAIKRIKSTESILEYGISNSLKKDNTIVSPGNIPKQQSIFHVEDIESSCGCSIEEIQLKKIKQQKKSQLINSRRPNQSLLGNFAQINSVNKYNPNLFSTKSGRIQNRTKIHSMSKLKPTTATTISNNSMKEIIMCFQRVKLKHIQEMKNIKGLSIRQKKRLEKIHQLQEKQYLIKVSSNEFNNHKI